MKRILLIGLVVLAVLGMTIYAVLRTLGPANPASFLPAGTVFYAALPDLPRTALRWPKTALAKLSADPEVKAFLEKPLAKLGEEGQGEAGEILMALKPGRIFAAVTEMTERGPEWLVGFQYFGGKKDLDAALARLRVQLDQEATPAEPQTLEYEGTEIVASVHGGLRLYTASHGKWGFLSGSESGIKAALDRIAGRDESPRLEKDETFTHVLGALPEAPDYVAFLRVPPVLAVVRGMATKLGAAEIPGQMQQLEQVQAAGFAGLLVENGIREAAYWKLTEAAPKLDPLNHTTLRFTTPRTLAYLAAVQEMDRFDPTAALQNVPPSIVNLLQERGLDPAALPQIFGPEAAIIINWPDVNVKPNALVAWQINDPEALEAWIQGIAAATLPSTDVSSDGKARYYSFPSLRSTFLDPTLAVTPNFLLAGADAQTVQAAVQLEGKETVEASGAFANVKSLYTKPNLQFGFIDTAAIFTRAYNQLKPVAIFGVSLIPSLAEYIDPKALPETDTIAAYLEPITLSLQEKGDGFLLESEGPVTLFQLFGVGGSVAVLSGIGRDR